MLEGLRFARDKHDIAARRIRLAPHARVPGTSVSPVAGLSMATRLLLFSRSTLSPGSFVSCKYASICHYRLPVLSTTVVTVAAASRMACEVSGHIIRATHKNQPHDSWHGPSVSLPVSRHTDKSNNGHTGGCELFCPRNVRSNCLRWTIVTWLKSGTNQHPTQCENPLFKSAFVWQISVVKVAKGFPISYGIRSSHAIDVNRQHCGSLFPSPSRKWQVSFSPACFKAKPIWLPD